MLVGHWTATHLVAVFADAHEEIIWLDVPVDEILSVDKLNAADHLQTSEACRKKWTYLLHMYTSNRFCAELSKTKKSMALQ